MSNFSVVKTNQLVNDKRPVDINDGEIEAPDALFLSGNDKPGQIYSVGYTPAFVREDGLRQGLRRGFMYQTMQIGVNAGYAVGQGQASANVNQGDTAFTPKANSVSDGIPLAAGLHLDESPDVVDQRALAAPVFVGRGIDWLADQGKFEVKFDGVYFLRVALHVVGGGQGTIRVSVDDDATGHEVIRAVDSLGSEGLQSSTATNAEYVNQQFIDWTAAAQTYLRLRPGKFTFRVLLDTTEDVEGWCVHASVTSLFPVNPNPVPTHNSVRGPSGENVMFA